MESIYAILDGGHPELGIEELHALYAGYNVNVSIEVKGRIAIAETDSINDSIAERVAYSKEVGRLICIADNIERISFDSKVFEKGSTFKVDSIGFDAKTKIDIDRSLGSRIMDIFPDCKVSVKQPDKTIRVLKLGDKFLIGLVFSKHKRRWIDRRPRSRSFFHPVAIYPKLARLLVNLCSVKEGEVFADPCCGTGSLLIEASAMGIDAFGLDISEKMVHGAKSNAIAGDKSRYNIALADSHYMPLRYADGIATDIPYGRAGPSFTRSMDISKWILEQASQILPSNRRTVIMSSSDQLPNDVSGMRLLKRYNLYVHRSLTRVISIFQKG